MNLTDKEKRAVADSFIGYIERKDVDEFKFGEEFAKGYRDGFQNAKDLYEDDDNLKKLKKMVSDLDNMNAKADDNLQSLAEDCDCIKMGDKVVHRVTGFKGTVTGLCEYVDTDMDARVHPVVGADGTFREAQWFTIGAVEKVK